MGWARRAIGDAAPAPRRRAPPAPPTICVTASVDSSKLACPVASPCACASATDLSAAPQSAHRSDSAAAAMGVEKERAEGGRGAGAAPGAAAPLAAQRESELSARVGRACHSRPPPPLPRHHARDCPHPGGAVRQPDRRQVLGDGRGRARGVADGCARRGGGGARGGAARGGPSPQEPRPTDRARCATPAGRDAGGTRAPARGRGARRPFGSRHPRPRPRHLFLPGAYEGDSDLQLERVNVYFNEATGGGWWEGGGGGAGPRGAASGAARPSWAAATVFFSFPAAPPPSRPHKARLTHNTHP